MFRAENPTKAEISCRAELIARRYQVFPFKSPCRIIFVRGFFPLPRLIAKGFFNQTNVAYPNNIVGKVMNG